MKNINTPKRSKKKTPSYEEINSLYQLVEKDIGYMDLLIQTGKLNEAYADLFNRYQWELHITLAFNHEWSLSEAEREARIWLKSQLHRFKKIRYGGIMIITNPYNLRPHIHIALASVQSYPRTLSDLNDNVLRLIESSWELYPFKNPKKFRKKMRKKFWEDRSCKITTWCQGNSLPLSVYLANEKNTLLDKPDSWTLEFIKFNTLIRFLGRESQFGIGRG